VREMILYSIRSETKPVKRFQNRSDVFEFWSLDNSSSKSILYVLETIYLKFRKVYGHFGPKTLRTQDISALVPKCPMDTSVPP